MKYALIYIIISFSIIQIKTELSTDNVIIAINCGGESFTDSRGVFYEKV